MDPKTNNFPGSTMAYCSDGISIVIGSLMGTSPVTVFVGEPFKPLPLHTELQFLETDIKQAMCAVPHKMLSITGRSCENCNVTQMLHLQ